MDSGSIELVLELLEDRIDAIRRVRPRTAGGRGRVLIGLVDELLTGVERERDRTVTQLAGASESERQVLGRKLLRLLSQVRTFSMLTPYLEDIGRNDLPMGLLQAIDLLIQELLPRTADPVIHLDEHHMYSTLDLVSLTAPIRLALGIADPTGPNPVVFFLPSTDPSNALLLPILAHEVGHAAIDQASLVSAVLSQADQKALDVLLDQCMKDADETNPTPWKIQLFRWLEESICDALAAILTGPSFLFAMAVFLPAPETGTVGTHPYLSDRVQMCLRVLRGRGWEPLLKTHSPNITAWLEKIDQPIDTSTRWEVFLRQGMRILEPAIIQVATSHVKSALEPTHFEGVQSFLAQLLHAGIPPAEIGGEPTEAWEDVLAGWLHRLREDGDRPATLVKATADVEFNASILKAIEMSRILRFWRDT